MADVKISAGADPGTLVGTDKIPLARAASTTAYAATMTEVGAFTNTGLPYSAASPAMDAVAAPGTVASVSRGDHVHPVDTSRYAASNPSGYQTAAQVQTAVAPALNDVGRNLLHNALFNVAQRGAGPFNASGPTVDRWVTATAGGTLACGRVAASDADRTWIGDGAAAFLLSTAFAGGVAAGDVTALYQRIEGVRRLAGKTITVSFFAVASGSIPIGISIDQNMGTGGSPSANVLGNGLVVTINTSGARYNVSFVVPSLAGKVLGTNGDDATQLNIWFSSGTTNAVRAGNIGVQSATVNLWGVQLEIGSVATQLEKPDPRYDLANCQRFYQTGSVQLLGYGAAGQTIGVTSSYPVVMRANPTVVTASVPVTNNITGGAITAYTASNTLLTGIVTALGNFNLAATYTASADL